MRIMGLVTYVMLLIVGVAGRGAHSQGLIEQDIWIPVPPVPSCTVPELAARVFDSLAIAGGVEYLPGRCLPSDAHSPVPAGERVSLRGLSAQEALNRLVEADRRFQWKAIDGIIVVRPVDAWNDPRHFLIGTVSLTFTEENVGGALTAILNALRPGGFESGGKRALATVQANREFSVSLKDVPALTALNAVVRGHGSLKWGVGYCQPERRREFARILLSTFDGAGMAGQPGLERNADGSSQDPCIVPSPK